MIRTVLAWSALFLLTPLCGLASLLTRSLGVAWNDPVMTWLVRFWQRGILRAAGVEVVVHGSEHARGQHLYVSNHTSPFDILALLDCLTNVRFIAAAWLARVPVFGAWARAAGTIYIDSARPRASADAYRHAATALAAGASIAIFPEGMRGYEYSLRPFATAPFALSIDTGVPIVPVVIHGTICVPRKGYSRVCADRVNVHLLEPVAVRGLTRADRHHLTMLVRERMATLLRDTYGVASPPWYPRALALRSSGQL